MALDNPIVWMSGLIVLEGFSYCSKQDMHVNQKMVGPYIKEMIRRDITFEKIRINLDTQNSIYVVTVSVDFKDKTVGFSEENTNMFLHCIICRF